LAKHAACPADWDKLVVLINASHDYSSGLLWFLPDITFILPGLLGTIYKPACHPATTSTACQHGENLMLRDITCAESALPLSYSSYLDYS
jgi:hypothetical protein